MDKPFFWEKGALEVYTESKKRIPVNYLPVTHDKPYCSLLQGNGLLISDNSRMCESETKARLKSDMQSKAPMRKSQNLSAATILLKKYLLQMSLALFSENTAAAFFQR